MLFKDLVNYFNIGDEFPQYLLDESFSEVFLKGDFSKKDGNYKIVAKTQKKVIHTMIIKPDDEFPLIVISKLPNGALNGIKFGRTKENMIYIDGL